jgi:hypothetical protein
MATGPRPNANSTTLCDHHCRHASTAMAAAASMADGSRKYSRSRAPRTRDVSLPNQGLLNSQPLRITKRYELPSLSRYAFCLSKLWPVLQTYNTGRSCRLQGRRQIYTTCRRPQASSARSACPAPLSPSGSGCSRAVHHQLPRPCRLSSNHIPLPTTRIVLVFSLLLVLPFVHSADDHVDQRTLRFEPGLRGGDACAPEDLG